MSTKTLQKHASWGPLALRVVVGLIFVIQGYSKLQGIDGFASMLANSGYPIALTLAWLVAIVELVAGAMLVLGIYTKSATTPLKVVIVFAIITKLFGGFGGAAWANIQWDLLLLASLTVLFGHGGGKWAVCPSQCCMTSTTPSAKDDSETTSSSSKDSSKKKSTKSSSKKKSSTKKKTTKKSSKKKSSKAKNKK